MLRLQRVGVALPDDFEPLHGIAGGILDAGDINAADLLVGLKNGWDVLLSMAMLIELPGQFDGVINGKLCPDPMAKWAV